MMPTKLRTALMSAGVVAVTAAGVLSATTPAFAKMDDRLSGPPAAQVGHAFRLTVRVGDDGGARPAWARLQVRGAHGGYQWLGTWHRLRLTDPADPDEESYVFTPAENHRGPVTFRAVLSGGYALTTNPVKVIVR
jgi:hypothetical protein